MFCYKCNNYRNHDTVEFPFAPARWRAASSPISVVQSDSGVSCAGLSLGLVVWTLCLLVRTSRLHLVLIVDVSSRPISCHLFFDWCLIQKSIWFICAMPRSGRKGTKNIDINFSAAPLTEACFIDLLDERLSTIKAEIVSELQYYRIVSNR